MTTSTATTDADTRSTTTCALAKLGGPVNRDEWFLAPQTVNAYDNHGRR